MHSALETLSLIHKRAQETVDALTAELARIRDLSASGRVPDVWCVDEAANRLVEAQMWITRSINRAKEPR